MSLQVQKGYVVRIDYQIKVKGGEVVESSEKTGPLQYTHGEGRLLPGLEAKLNGMGVGQEDKGVLSSEEAFGKEDAFPTQDIPAKEMPDDVKEGAFFEAKLPDGNPVIMKVLKAGKEVVQVRLLPPLAGKELEYSVRVLMIDDPKTKRRESVAPPPPPSDAILEDGA